MILQLVLEVFGDIIIHTLAEERRVRNVVLAVLGYVAAGIAVGFLSVLLFPRHFIRREEWQLLNLVVTPVAIAGFMAWVGNSRERRDQQVVRLEQFGFAYTFALSLALVRFFRAS